MTTNSQSTPTISSTSHDWCVARRRGDQGRFLHVRFQVEEGWYEGVLDGKLGLFPSNYVTRVTEETSKNDLAERRHSYANDRLGSKKDPPMKRKPANGLSALISKEVRVQAMLGPP